MRAAANAWLGGRIAGTGTGVGTGVSTGGRASWAGKEAVSEESAASVRGRTSEAAEIGPTGSAAILATTIDTQC